MRWLIGIRDVVHLFNSKVLTSTMANLACFHLIAAPRICWRWIICHQITVGICSIAVVTGKTSESRRFCLPSPCRISAVTLGAVSYILREYHFREIVFRLIRGNTAYKPIQWFYLLRMLQITTTVN